MGFSLMLFAQELRIKFKLRHYVLLVSHCLLQMSIDEPILFAI